MLFFFCLQILVLIKNNTQPTLEGGIIYEDPSVSQSIKSFIDSVLNEKDLQQENLSEPDLQSCIAKINITYEVFFDLLKRGDLRKS
jgi:hypothetical protein